MSSEELSCFILQVWTGGFPCVFKIGHAHGGLGKVKVENDAGFEDIKGVVAVSNQYCTIEKFVEAYCDLHVFKIGDKYKAVMRRSLTGNWKSNVGDVEVKEVPVQDRYKRWIDEAASMFGGLELCSLEAIVDKTGITQITRNAVECKIIIQVISQENCSCKQRKACDAQNNHEFICRPGIYY